MISLTRKAACTLCGLEGFRDLPVAAARKIGNHGFTTGPDDERAEMVLDGETIGELVRQLEGSVAKGRTMAVEDRERGDYEWAEHMERIAAYEEQLAQYLARFARKPAAQQQLI